MILTALFFGALVHAVPQRILQQNQRIHSVSDDQSSRLRVTNGCQKDNMWINYQVGAPYGACGTMTDPDFIQLAPNEFYDYKIPAQGLCGFRLWPSMRCGDEGKAVGLSGDKLDCEIGSSGGLHSQPYCPSDLFHNAGIGCAPPIDSKFEGTFGCVLGSPGQCQTTPQGGNLYQQPDSWDTSLVDGWTLPFDVEVLDDCPGGPKNNKINCSALTLDECPASEDLSNNNKYPNLKGQNLALTHPVTNHTIGCKSPCARLCKGQWFSIPHPPFDGVTYDETSDEANMYCCPSTITPDECRVGVVTTTDFVNTVHRDCPQVYAYSYDDAGSLWQCGAGTRYHVTFYCPN